MIRPSTSKLSATVQEIIALFGHEIVRVGFGQALGAVGNRVYHTTELRARTIARHEQARSVPSSRLA